MGGGDLTVDAVIADGGWDARFAVVAALAIDGDMAVALVAGNGLGYEMELDLLVRLVDGWQSMFSVGVGWPLEGATIGTGPTAVYATGWVEPGKVSTILVALGPDVDEVRPNDQGFWIWLRRTDDDPWKFGEPEITIA